jgi:glycerate 2-kinase
VAILSGGELTVTLRGKGRGGPNQEYALALAIHLDGAPALPRWRPIPTEPTAAAAARTTRPAPLSTHDAERAPGPPASIPPRFSPTTIPRGFSTAIGDLFRPGPTFTNVTDFRAIVVDRP